MKLDETTQQRGTTSASLHSRQAPAPSGGSFCAPRRYLATTARAKRNALGSGTPVASEIGPEQLCHCDPISTFDGTMIDDMSLDTLPSEDSVVKRLTSTSAGKRTIVDTRRRAGRSCRLQDRVLPIFGRFFPYRENLFDTAGGSR